MIVNGKKIKAPKWVEKSQDVETFVGFVVAEDVKEKKNGLSDIQVVLLQRMKKSCSLKAIQNQQSKKATANYSKVI